MTTPEPVSPDDRDPFEVAYDADQDSRDLTGPERAALNDALTPPVSPAPDTWDLRHRLAARLARLDAEQWGGDHDFAPYGKDRESDSVVDAAVEVFEAVQAEREAGLRADLDRAHAEVERLETLVVEKHELIQGWARYGERVKAERAKYGDMLIDVLGITGPVGRWFEHLVPAAVQEIERLRAELAGARTIPDDAAERQVGYAVEDVLAAWGIGTGMDRLCLTGTETAALVRSLVKVVLRPAPTTDPAPAAADGTCSCNGGWVEDQNFQPEDYERNDPLTPGKGLIPCGLCNHGGWDADWPPAAPQAPAEPTASARLFNRLIAGASVVNGVPQTPAAREDAATPPLPLHEQADLLTWRVVHVPPGTTDREDTDTPITPGWWLVGHGEDPDHPDVQVHLGDRLPTSSAATPAGGSHEVEVTVQDDGWATAECRTCTASIGESAEDTVQDWADRHRADTLRPGSLTPIQPEEA